MMAEESPDDAAAPRHRASHRRVLTSKSQVSDRADTEHRPKTTLPKIAGSYKLPPSSLLHRPDEQQAVHEEELKLLAAGFDRKVRGIRSARPSHADQSRSGGHDFRVQA